MNKLSKKKLYIYKYIFGSVMWVGLLLPLLIVIINNWDKYFVQRSGYTVGFGGVLAILLVVLALKFGASKFHKIFWTTSLLMVVYCLDTIIVDLKYLVFAFWLGSLFYSIFEVPYKFFAKRVDTYNDEEVRMTARYNSRSENTANEEKSEGRY